MLEESDTYLMILEQGEERGAEKTRRGDILLLGEARLGPPDEAAQDKLTEVTDLERLNTRVGQHKWVTERLNLRDFRNENGPTGLDSPRTSLEQVV